MDMPTVRYPLQFVLALKAGNVRGRHELTLVPQLPSGETLPSHTVSVQMEGEGKRVNLVLQLDIPYAMEGLYWFQIRFNGLVLTRIPLELRYSRMVTGAGA